MQTTAPTPSTSQPSTPRTATTQTATTGPVRPVAVGRPLSRVDGRLKVTGAARYTAEWDVPGLAYGAPVGSPIASGIVRSIDAAAALRAPGVIAVLTHENAPRLRPLPERAAGTMLRGPGGISEERQPLQDTTIHYADQTLAVVVADTLERARHAATLVRVDCEARAPELSLENAARKSLPERFVGNNEETLQKDIGDPAAALAAAEVRLERTYESAVTHHNPIELIATIAQWDERDGGAFLTLHDTARVLEGVEEVAATSFGIPRDRVRVICHFIGGAFGAKGWTFFNPLIAAMAARVAHRPVKIEWRRQDMFAIAGHRAETSQTFAIGAARDGKIDAFRHDTRTRSSMVGGFTEPCARMTRMMYAVPNIGFSHRTSHLNLPTPCPMRGPGETVGGWAMECALDELATELNLDPIELRLRNYADANPETGKPFSSKHLRERYARGSERFGWARRDPKPRSMRSGNSLVGYGMSTTMYPAGRRKASARATVFADGRALVQSATHELGNGAYTIFRQISADGLSMPVDRVRFELGDSTLPTAPGTGGSVTTASVGPAALQAGRNAVIALKRLAINDPQSPLAGAAEEAIDARDGRLFLTSRPDAGDEYAAILRRAGVPSVVADGEAGPGAEREKFSFYSFGAIFAEVRVDEALGTIRVARLCGVFDAGRLMNEKTATSQILGGMTMGLGATLMEETLYDPRNGRAVTRNLADVHVPCMADTPEMTVEWLEYPDPHMGELGGRGVGEMGCVGTPAAITNAVYHATGRRLRSLPLTPDKVLATPS